LKWAVFAYLVFEVNGGLEDHEVVVVFGVVFLREVVGEEFGVVNCEAVGSLGEAFFSCADALQAFAV
jgi:hypothetical protein